MPTIDLDVTSLRDFNQMLHDLEEGANDTDFQVVNPRGKHAIAAGVDAPITVEIDGNVGYYCGGMNKRANIVVNGSAGVGLAENMMSGRIHVKGDASSSAGATGCGGLLVIDGNASGRCGISARGIDIVVKGSVGHMSAFMAQAGTLVVLGDAGDALGDSIYEARLFVRGKREEPWRRLHREVDVATSTSRTSRKLLDEAGIGGEVDVGRVQALRLGAEALSLPYGQSGGLLMSAEGRWVHTPPRLSATFDEHSIAEIQRAAATGIYDIRGFGAKRKVPHFDDLLFLGASISRYPLEGYREKCATDVVLGTRFAKKPLHLKIPITIAGMSFGSLSGPAKEALGPRRQRRRHLDHDRRRRHDGGGARSTPSFSSIRSCRRATA